MVKLASFQVHRKWELPADSSGFHVSASCKPAIQQRGEIICSHALWLVLAQFCYVDLHPFHFTN